ncbi:putative quinol monooxygenase [Kribbella sp. NPDC050281]|uniref:putative quinol monooxygenase n=1 Tax=Kribbella sp. NPDC050281 TaxID=3155515 RepID=UPI003402D232
MLSLTVSFQVVPGHLDLLVEAIRTQAERSITKEPGCLYFDVGQDTADDHHVTLYELYADDAAVEAHRSTPHFKVWREALAEHVVPGSLAVTVARRLIHHADEG